MSTTDARIGQTLTVVTPAAAPCASCPYRRDVPSGIWDESEYAKLLRYDGATWEQDPALFLCHQQNGRACAGWVGCHEMSDNLALRLASARGDVDVDEFLDYVSPIPLFGSGAEASAHGLAEVELPGAPACKAIERLERKFERVGK